MKIERLKEIRKVTVNINEKYFDMSILTHKCGAPSCILGHAFIKLCENKKAFTDARGNYDYRKWIASYLGLEENLLTAHDIGYLFGEHNINSISDALARIDKIIKIRSNKKELEKYRRKVIKNFNQSEAYND